MGLLDLLLGRGSETDRGGAGETETVRKIVARLESLPPQRARWIGAFAFVLGRVAHADRDISESETARMEQIVREVAGLAEAEAVLVVEIARAQHVLFGGTESFVVTREFGEIASRAEKEKLLDCLFSVSAADESISAVEDAETRQIAAELGFSHREYVAARAAWSDKRDVLREFRGQRER
jgi:uncharacterized tellurite resistance protein B-like protein